MKLSPIAALALVGLNFLYAGTSIFSKMASGKGWGSGAWMLWMAGTVATMGLYALLWQQALRRVPVATAYVFRGTTLLFVLVLSHCLFGEPVTARNLIGAGLIVGGIALYAGT